MIAVPNGFVMAQDISVGDTVLTVSPDNLVLNENNMYEFNTTNGNINLVETTVTESTKSEEKSVFFNDDMTAVYSIHQPIFIKKENGVTSVQASDVVVGDKLITIDSDGSVVETEVNSVNDSEDSITVYTIRTGPHRWFIAGGNLVIS
jgi:hypothetical protein